MRQNMTARWLAATALAAGLAVLAQDAPRLVRNEFDRFRQEVEQEAERLAGLLAAAEAVEAGHWVPQDVAAHELPQRFGFQRNPRP